MQSCDLLPTHILITPKFQSFDLPTMADPISSPIQAAPDLPATNGTNPIEDESNKEMGSENIGSKTKESNPVEDESNKAMGSENIGSKTKESNPVEDESNKDMSSENIGSKTSKSSRKESSNNNNNVIVRRERPTRACTTRPAKYVDPPVIERRSRPVKRERVEKVVVEEVEEEENEGETKEVFGKIITPLVNEPTMEQMPRWKLRSMWELASILNFLNVFRPLLHVTVEFSAEELESALLTPNATLGDVHIPLLKGIPPVTRMACTHDTWVTVLCRKLRDWWHWVAEGELPIVTAQGAEIETYKNLDPGVRVVILKALCDIRVEQEDIRTYIDNSLKHGLQLSAFRKERIGGDSHGISYWYEEDEVIGHRLYREIRKVEKKLEMKKGRTRGSHVMPSTSYEWETVATNLDEFVDVSEKLFSSRNRTEASVGKKLKNDMLPEIERIHKKKERMLKKQQREALLLNNFVTMDGLVAGRSLRDRKPVTYTFDDFDRSINEAIKITKNKPPSPEPAVRREGSRTRPSTNGKWNDGASHASPSQHVAFSPSSLADYDEMDEDNQPGPLDRSNRRRQRPRRYSDREFVNSISDNNEDFDSDEIVGEAVYDDEYLKQRKNKKILTFSSSDEEGEEGDEEFHWSEENGEDEAEEEDEEEDEDSLSNVSEDSDRPTSRRSRRPPERRAGAHRRARLRSVDDELDDSGLRRSKRATRNRINYRQYEFSDSENESTKYGSKSRHSDAASEDADDFMEEESQDSEGSEEDRQLQRGYLEPTPMAAEKEESQPAAGLDTPALENPDPDPDRDGVGKRGFLDLNELAPGPSFEDGSSALVKDDDDVKGD